MELKQHPLSAAFPAMSAEDFQALKDDIENNGQREPVMVFEGMVLDGWHRYRACVDLGLKPQQFTFPADEDPVAFVLSHNLHRRHLTSSQRAAAVVACSAWAPAHRLKNKQEPGSPLSKTNADMAKAAHVSDKTIKDAKAAHKAGLGDAVKQGAMTVKEAAAVARGKPAAAPKPAPKAPAPAPTEDFGPSEAEIAAAQREQEEELASLRRIAESDDKLRAALEENKQLRAQVRVMQERINSLVNENAASIREAKRWKRKAEAHERTTV